MDPQIIPFRLKRAPDGVLTGGYIPVNPSNSWKVAPAYDIADDLPIEIIHPRTDSTDPVARWKWAHWDDTYELFFDFVGGRPPYRVSLLSAPDGAYLGASGTSREQVFNFITDLDVPGMYTLDMPDDFGLIRWTPTVEQRGQAHRFVVRLEDMAGRVIDHSFSPTVDTPAAPKFRYANSVTGSNVNPGTKALPFQTWQHVYSQPDAGNFIYVFDGGTYIINDGTPGNNAAVNASKPRSFIGKNSARFDMSTGHFAGSPSDVFFDNIELYSGRATDAYVRVCSWGSRFDRLFYQRCRWRSTPLGTLSVVDNPACVFTPDVADIANRSKYFGMRNCDIDSTVQTALVVLFAVQYVQIRKCTGLNLNMNGHIALGKTATGMFLSMKDSIADAEISYCSASGYTDNGLIQWMNQSPEYCTNQRTRFCKLEYPVSNTLYAPIVYNSQAEAVGSRGTNQRIERCSIKVGAATPVISTRGGAGGEPVKVSGILYSGGTALFSVPVNAQAVNTTSIQITAAQFDANMNMVAAVKAVNLGLRGGQMATTMVS